MKVCSGGGRGEFTNYHVGGEIVHIIIIYGSVKMGTKPQVGQERQPLGLGGVVYIN